MIWAHSCATGSLPAGDLGLTDDLSGFQEIFPLNGFSEEFDYSGGLRYPGRFGVAPAGQDCAQHLIGWRPAHEGADVAVFEDPLGPERYLNGLFVVGGHRGAIVAILGGMDNPEEDLGFFVPLYEPHDAVDIMSNMTYSVSR